MPKRYPAAAAIDIGSSEIRLHVAQATPFDKVSPASVNYLDILHYPLSLGRDTFNAGKMSFDKVDKACEIIKNFLDVSRGYGVKNVQTVASTAMREAANADYILDQIKIKTGIAVNVLDDLEEKHQIYKLITHYGERYFQDSALVVYIGTGHVGVSLFLDGKITRTWSISVGSLRMGELFGQMQEYTRDFYKLMEEFFMGYTISLKKELPDKIQHFIVSGREIDLISRLAMPEIPPLHGANPPLFEIPRQDFEALYDKIKRKTPDRIATDFSLDTNNAEALLPAACIYQTLLGFTSAEVITAARIWPCDTVLFETLYPKRFIAIDRYFDRGTLISAENLARRHGANMPHALLVKDFALNIFEKIKKLHGLGHRDKLLLSASSLLHDVGEVVNNRDHHKMSYAIVRGSDLVGLSQTEQEMVALICRYHSAAMPDTRDAGYAALDTEKKVRVSKLAAMLRLADALDRSHAQKYTKISVKLAEHQLIISADTTSNVSLEKWAFIEKGRFFEEVFGIKAELKIKKI